MILDLRREPLDWMSSPASFSTKHQNRESFKHEKRRVQHVKELDSQIHFPRHPHPNRTANGVSLGAEPSERNYRVSKPAVKCVAMRRISRCWTRTSYRRLRVPAVVRMQMELA